MRTVLMLACFATACAYAQYSHAEGTSWEIEQGVIVPSYAVAEPTATDLNIDRVVLGCEHAGKGRVLQLQLYLSDDGRLRPIGVSSAGLTNDPRAGISIDGKQYPVTLMFAGDYVLLADSHKGASPGLSDRLLDAMQTGRTMILQFELLVRRPGRHAGFDTKATLDLMTAGAKEAIAALKQCAGAPALDA
jgi:hypothetical protein